MTSPITEQARQLAPVANQDSPAGLENSRGFSTRQTKPAKPKVDICPKCGLCYVAGKAPEARDPCPTCRLKARVEHEKAMSFLKMRTVFAEFDEDGFNPTCTIALASDGTIMQAWHHRDRKELRWKPLPAFDSTLLNQAPHIAGPNQVPPAPG